MITGKQVIDCVILHGIVPHVDYHDLLFYLKKKSCTVNNLALIFLTLIHTLSTQDVP